MYKISLFFLLFIPSLLFSQNQENKILLAIQNNSILSMGGCDLIQVDGITYIAGVSAVDVGTKTISSLMRVAKVKASREITTFVNGSDITSKTESFIKEELTIINDSSSLTTVDSFVEYIREDSEGFVNAMLPAGYWYSDDKSLFFYALYKEVKL